MLLCILVGASSLVADARKVLFQSNYFDVITNNCGFSQILGYTKALHEAFRMLKPGGKMVMREIMGITRWDDSKLRSTIASQETNSYKSTNTAISTLTRRNFS